MHLKCLKYLYLFVCSSSKLGVFLMYFGLFGSMGLTGAFEILWLFLLKVLHIILSHIWLFLSYLFNFWNFDFFNALHTCGQSLCFKLTKFDIKCPDMNFHDKNTFFTFNSKPWRTIFFYCFWFYCFCGLKRHL